MKSKFKNFAILFTLLILIFPVFNVKAGYAETVDTPITTSETTNVDLLSGDLTSNQDLISFPDVKINFTTPPVSNSTSEIYVNDSRGTGTGWSVSLSATNFSMNIPSPSNPETTISPTILISAVELTVNNIKDLNNNQPTNDVKSPSVLTLSVYPQEILTADPGYGMGYYSANLNWSFTLPNTVRMGKKPGGLYMGTYTSTFTFTTTAGV